ncbi:hypothetical protein HanIR_Chr01g0045701 [Helianthus annuus]|nr:hypothetical protein HanIR_Chr01g0045701 [Helianthus annuus]
MGRLTIRNMKFLDGPRNRIIIIFEPTLFLIKFRPKCRQKYSRSKDKFIIF